MPEHGETLELALEELAKRLGRDFPRLESGAAVAQDDVDAGIVDPRACLGLNGCLVEADDGAGLERMTRGCDPFGQQIARGVRARIVRVRDRHDGEVDGREYALGVDSAARPSLARKPASHRGVGGR